MRMDSRLRAAASAGLAALAAVLGLGAEQVAAGELTAHAAVSNNYLWRGLTQTMNEPAVSGGLDYATDGPFYIGTRVSNVSFAPNDVFSYQHDVRLGFSGGERVPWDAGYVYYNYDDIAGFDFGEVYASIGFRNFSITGFALANTQAEERPGEDFGFGQAFYLSADYVVELGNGTRLTLHVGRRDGDFSEAFNDVPGAYVDYSVSLSKGGFRFTLSDTDLESEVADSLDNGSMKVVVGYSIDFDL